MGTKICRIYIPPTSNFKLCNSRNVPLGPRRWGYRCLSIKDGRRCGLKGCILKSTTIEEAYAYIRVSMAWVHVYKRFLAVGRYGIITSNPLLNNALLLAQITVI